MPRNNYPNRRRSAQRTKGDRPDGRRDSQSRDSVRTRRGRERHLSVRAELRETPDVRKIARAVIAMALAQAEADAAAQAQADAQTDASGEPPPQAGPESLDV